MGFLHVILENVHQSGPCDNGIQFKYHSRSTKSKRAWSVLHAWPTHCSPGVVVLVFTQPGRNSVVSYTGTEFLIQIAFLIFIDQHPFLCKNMLINLGAKKFANCWAKSVLQITKKQPHLFFVISTMGQLIVLVHSLLLPKKFLLSRTVEIC